MSVNSAIFHFFLLIAVAAYGGQGALTEEDAVLRALRNSPDILLLQIDKESDSLSLELAKSPSDFTLGVSVPLSYTRTQSQYVNTVPGDIDIDQETSQLAVNVEGGKPLPGGGAIKANVGEELLKRDNQDITSNLSGGIGLTQPFLKGMGRHSPIAFRIKQQEVSSQISRIALRGALSRAITDIRGMYWDLMIQSGFVNIRKREYDMAISDMTYQLARFKLGAVSAMDTLSGRIDLLRAQSALVTAKQQALTKKRALSQALGMGVQDLYIDFQEDIPIMQMPDSSGILQQALEASQDLRTLKLTYEKLEGQLAYDKNRLIPSLDLNLGYNQGIGEDNSYRLRRNQSLSAGLTFVYDIFNCAGKISVQKTRAELAAARINQSQGELELSNSITDFLESWRSDSLRYSLQSEEAYLAGQRYKAMLEEEKLGKVDAFTREKVQNEWINSQMERLNRAIALKKIEIALDHATGRVFTKFGVELP